MPHRAALQRWRWAAWPAGIAAISRVVSTLLVLAVAGLERGAWPRLTNQTSPLLAWDGQWYLRIAESGYHAAAIQGATHHDYAFLPAWPVAIRIASLGVLPLGTVAVVAADALFVAAAVAVYRVLTDRLDERAARGGLLLLAFGPAAYVFSLAYSESLFLLVAALGFVAGTATLRRPMLSGLVTLVRITGLAVVAAAAVEAARSRGSARRGALLAVGGGIVGFGLWTAFVTHLTGDPLASVLASHDWQGTTGPRAFRQVLLHPELVSLAWVAVAVLCLAAAVALWRRDPILATYAIVAIAMGVGFGRASSMPRFTLVAFPAYAVLAGWADRRDGRRGRVALLVAGFALQLVFVAAAFGGGDAPP